MSSKPPTRDARVLLVQTPFLLNAETLKNLQPRTVVLMTSFGEMAQPKNAKRKAIVLTADKFEDMELYIPVYRLLEAGWQVDVAAPKKETIYGERGYPIEPTLTIDEVVPDKYDLLIIPGGFPDGAPLTVRKMKNAIATAKSFFGKNKPVASICHGPWTLASANVIKGRHLTSYWHDGVPEDIRNAGGVWEDQDVVVDGNLVTSRWPMDLPAFTREMMKLVNSKEKSTEKTNPIGH